MSVSSRVFGSNINPKIQAKLRARQGLNITSRNVLESLTSANPDLYENAGMNFNFKDVGGATEMSSRTPFVRMWTCVQVLKSDSEGSWEEIQVGEYGKADKEYDYREWGEEGEEDTLLIFQRRKRPTSVEKIYQLGNHIGDSIKFGDSIVGDEAQDQTNEEAELQAMKSLVPDEFATNKNQFITPPAGITSLTSTTLGSGGVGGVRKTSISFTVYNAHDYDQIYSKYFLRPGAQVFVDFGWAIEKLKLYNPNDIINDENFNETLFGNGVDAETKEMDLEKIGEIYKAEGDWDIVHGTVSTFSAEVGDTGEFKCSIDIVSRNVQLFGISLEEGETKLKRKLVNRLDKDILKYASTWLFPENSKFNYKDDKKLTENEWKTIYATAASHELGGSGKFPVAALMCGVYWKGVGIGEDESIPSTTNNIYISYGFFEDQILNKEFAKVMKAGDDDKAGVTNKTFFDSRRCWVKMPKLLLEKQQFYRKSTSKLDFLYPIWEGDGLDVTYNSLIDKRPGNGQMLNFGKHCKDNTKIPLRELFISLKLIKRSISSAKTLNDVFLSIMHALNKGSQDIFELILESTGLDGGSLGIVDKGQPNIKAINNESDSKKFYDNMFVFHPHSPNTIIKAMSLNYSPGSDRVAAKMGIQAMGPGGKDQIPKNAVAETDMMESFLNGIDIMHLPSSWNKDGKDKVKSEESGESDSGGITVSEFKGMHVPLSSKSTGFVEARYKQIDENKGTKEEEDPKVAAENKKEFTDKLEETNNVKVCRSPGDYWDYTLTQEKTKIKPMMVPMKLQLTVDGFAGYINGDVFTIDYLPKRYRGKVFFQVMKYTHNVGQGSWDTELETVMRIRHDVAKELSKGTAMTKKIVLSKFYLESMGLNSIKRIIPALLYITNSDIPLNFQSKYPELDYIFNVKTTRPSSDHASVIPSRGIDMGLQTIPKPEEGKDEIDEGEEKFGGYVTKFLTVQDTLTSPAGLKMGTTAAREDVSVEEVTTDGEETPAADTEQKLWFKWAVTPDKDYKIFIFGQYWYVVPHDVSNEDLDKLMDGLYSIFFPDKYSKTHGQGLALKSIAAVEDMAHEASHKATGVAMMQRVTANKDVHELSETEQYERNVKLVGKDTADKIASGEGLSDESVGEDEDDTFGQSTSSENIEEQIEGHTEEASSSTEEFSENEWEEHGMTQEEWEEGGTSEVYPGGDGYADTE